MSRVIHTTRAPEGRPVDGLIRTFYSDGFAADIGAHVMPMKKFALVKERILARGLPSRVVVPEIGRAHV